MELTIADDKLDSKELHKIYDEWVKEKISPKTTPVNYKEFKEQLKYSTTFIAKEKNKILGFLMCKIKKSTENTIMYNLKKGEEYAMIDSIYVKKTFRKKGIGTKLLNECKKELKLNGYKKSIVLADSVNMEKLTNFYKKNGFKTLFVSMINEE